MFLLFIRLILIQNEQRLHLTLKNNTSRREKGISAAAAVFWAWSILELIPSCFNKPTFAARSKKTLSLFTLTIFLPVNSPESARKHERWSSEDRKSAAPIKHLSNGSDGVCLVRYLTGVECMKQGPLSLRGAKIGVNNHLPWQKQKESGTQVKKH